MILLPGVNIPSETCASRAAPVRAAVSSPETVTIAPGSERTPKRGEGRERTKSMNLSHPDRWCERVGVYCETLADWIRRLLRVTSKLMEVKDRREVVLRVWRNEEMGPRKWEKREAITDMSERMTMSVNGGGERVG